MKKITAFFKFVTEVVADTKALRKQLSIGNTSY